MKQTILPKFFAGNDFHPVLNAAVIAFAQKTGKAIHIMSSIRENYLVHCNRNSNQAGRFENPYPAQRIRLRYCGLSLAFLFFFGSWGFLQGQDVLMQDGQIVRACKGLFMDSGGANQGYRPNESSVMVICPDNTTGTHTRLTFPGVAIDVIGDDLCFFDGPNVNAPLLSCSDDFGGPFIIQATAANPGGCVTIRFRSNGSVQGSGWVAAIDCVPACQTIMANISGSDPVVAPIDTGYIDACPNQLVSLSAIPSFPQNNLLYFQSADSVTYEWNFGDGVVKTGRNISHRFKDPGGYVVELRIADRFGCQSTNFVKQRVRISPGPEFLVADDDRNICQDDTIRLNAIVNSRDTGMYDVAAAPQPGIFQPRRIRADSLALPDGTGAAYESKVFFFDFPPGAVLSDPANLESICVNMEHSWARDLEISIRCPSGRSVELHNHPGNFGSEVYIGDPIDSDDAMMRPGTGADYCWTSAGRETWLEYANRTGVQRLPPGDYRSSGNLAGLVGCPLNGEWTIHVIDNWSLDNGYIFSWSIGFRQALFNNIETFTPGIQDYSWATQPSVIFRSSDELVAVPNFAGNVNYNFSLVDDFGCKWDTMVNYTVLPPTHPDCYNCMTTDLNLRDTVLCDGESVLLDVSAVSPDIPPVVFETHPDYDFPGDVHPPALPYTSTISVNSIVPSLLANPNLIESVCFDLETDFDEDIQVYLRAPNGTRLELTTNNGANGSNYTQTCFSPGAADSIRLGSAPFTGSFIPEGDWNALLGANVNGNWVLEVADAQFESGDHTRLKSWSITFNTENRVTYTWQPAAGLSCTNCPRPIASPTNSTTYTVLVTDSYNCDFRDTVQILKVNSIPAPVVSCDTTGSRELTFAWLPVNGIDSFEISVNGAAWMSPTDPLAHIIGDLRVRDTVLLSVRPLVNLPPGTNCEVATGDAVCYINDCSLRAALQGLADGVTCAGRQDGKATLRVSRGEGPFLAGITGQSAISFADSLLTVMGLGSGLQQLAVSDRFGCADTLVVDIPSPPPAITVNAVQTIIGCHGLKNSEASVNASGGSGSFTYLWSNGQNGPNGINLDTTLYTITATDVNGCTGMTTLAIRDHEPIDPNIISNSPSCAGYGDGSLGVNFVSGGTGQGYTYQWSTTPVQTGSVANNIRGNRMYRLTVTDNQGCAGVREIFVEDPNPIIFEEMVTPATCFGSATGRIQVVNVQGDFPDFTYRWSANAGGVTAAELTGIPAGQYSVTVTDAAGCFAGRSITVMQPPKIEIDFATVNNKCYAGQSGSLESTVRGGVPGYAYQWSNQFTSTGLQNLPAGLYVLTITDANNCIAVDSQEVTQPPNLATNVVLRELQCFGDRNGAIIIEASGATPPYVMSLDGNNYRNLNSFVGLGAGTYNINIRDANGCTWVEKTTLQSPEPFAVSAGAPEFEIELGDSLMLIATARDNKGQVEFTWSAPYEGTQSCVICQEVVVNPQYTIQYILRGVDETGCQAEQRIEVIVRKTKYVAVPTGFSPNGDVTNDLLLVHGREGTVVKQFRVFDRWGEMVYEGLDFAINDDRSGWDGSFRGAPMPPGVYIWQLTVEYIDGEQESFSGETTLIR